MAAVKASRVHAVVAPANVIAASAAAAINPNSCAPIRRRRRSTMSASAPAGRASANIGKVVAACTSATISGSGDSEVISQPAPTSCIQVPTLDTMVAIQSARNVELASGPLDAVLGTAV